MRFHLGDNHFSKQQQLFFNIANRFIPNFNGENDLFFDFKRFLLYL